MMSRLHINIMQRHLDKHRPGYKLSVFSYFRSNQIKVRTPEGDYILIENLDHFAKLFGV